MAPRPPPRRVGRGIQPVKRHGVHGGKRVVFVTPHFKAAEEEAKKHSDRGQRTEIKKEKDDTGMYVYTVFVFELG